MPAVHMEPLTLNPIGIRFKGLGFFTQTFTSKLAIKPKP